MRELITSGKHEIVGRGTIYTVNLKDNDLSQEIKVFNKQLKLGEKVIIEGEEFIINGIETFQTLQGFQTPNIGVMVKRK